MSSRILRFPDLTDAPPVEWRRAEGPGAAPARAYRSDARAAAGGDASPEEIARAVQARLESTRQQARAEGEAAGLARAGQRLDPVIASFQAMMADLAGQRARVRAEAEVDTVKLALAIAHRVLYRELSIDPDAILGLVKAAFGKLSARETHRLRVCPEDAAAMEENRGRLELPARVEIARDPSLARGSAVFETSRGEMDASIDTQLVEIERGLTDIMKRRTA
jgi:flagellar assembly protein FliH